MEWIEGSTLQDKISESYFGKSKRVQVFKQLLEALMYLYCEEKNNYLITYFCDM